ncbi:MAG TPA: NUMOD4 motif-containing HNH endonuclease [Streptosporangiaceae bacterium]|nr:NUMOD4 motif-containing HNH endonuclease [Streptosporangiaceae bacterium]
MADVEEWRPVVGHAGLYEVSSLGQVRRLSRTTSDGRRIQGRVLRPAGIRYLTVKIGGDTRTVHSLAAEAFRGLRPAPGMEVRHLDDNKLNNAAANLAWGTRSENIQDRIRNGILYQLDRFRCLQGHEWTEANTIIVRRRDGSFKQRLCRQCRTDNKRAAYQRKKQERAEAA